MHPSVTSPARPFGLGSGQSSQPPRAGRFHEAGVLCRPSQEGETSGDEEYRVLAGTRYYSRQEALKTLL
ncbi:hypothetical protein PGTUg99_015114 [Puccinia graminis f. sp. tritici]|uniref:Uncharacterized protein n=1 Tax=Puccinia graminis f. sp. tritici TaxID=56615 RepID=A0A5B0PLR0_PUCGR|nr:hypothetical protein PGTUg99_015114 [Puccinia graminis f. sp. tritici]